MNAKRSHWILRGAAVAALLLACHAASAQHSTGFEPPGITGTPTGFDLNGQDGYYNPLPATSISAKVFTYAGNTLGIPPNPSGGGEQFVGAEGPGGSFFARSEREIPFGTGTGTWRLSVDVAITFSGVLPTGQYIGSISLVPLEIAAPANQSFIALANWPEPITATTWNAGFVYWPATGGYVIEPLPDPGFENLQINHWYRWSVIFDFDSGLVTEISVVDLTTGSGTTFNPTGWYLSGGSAGLPAPEGFRLFGGNSTYFGNTTCWDNLVIEPFVGCPEDINGDGIVDVLDLLDLLAAWGAAGGPADINGDGIVDVLDLLLLLAAWGPC